MKLMRVFSVAGLLVGLCCGFASGRTWTNSAGKTIEAEFVKLEGETVHLRKGGKIYKLALDKLSEEDREFARKQAAGEEEAAEPEIMEPFDPAELRLAGNLLEVGKLNTVTVSLNDANQVLAKEGLKGWRDSFIERYNAPGDWMKPMNTGHAVTEAKMVIGVPPNFDPRKKDWPVYIRWGSSGSKKHTKVPQGYWDVCSKEGWVLIAVDSLPDAKAGWSTPVFYANIKQILEDMHQSWPSSKEWPLVVGGGSGGAKIAQWMGPLISELPDTDVRGLWVGACNECFLPYAHEDLRLSTSSWKNMRVYTSTGLKDKLVGPRYRDAVEEGLKAAGIRQLRTETHPGGHSLNFEQFEEGVKWILETEDK